MEKFPDFFIVGASKAGTTSICAALASHPNICFSDPKEPNFFSKFDSNLEQIPEKDLSTYQSLFISNNNIEQIFGEGSVDYLCSTNASHWIKRYAPNAKIIIVLRNPLKRIVSLYEMYFRIRKKLKFTPDELFRPGSFLFKQCLLADEVSRYQEIFSPGKVHVLLFEDFIKNPQSQMEKLCYFLGIKRYDRLNLERRNTGGVPKAKFLNFLKNRNLIEFVKKILPKFLHGKIDNFIKGQFYTKLTLTPDQITTLKNAFYEDVLKTGALINRDLCQEWQIHQPYEDV